MRKNILHFCLGFLVMVMLGTCGVIAWEGDYLGDAEPEEEEIIPSFKPCVTEDGIETIGDENELRAIVNNPSGSYCLEQDIILIRNWEPLATFTGTLDGRGRVISGLIIDDQTGFNVGFFRELGERATVKNLIFDAPNVKGTGETGVLAGVNNNTAIIENLQITDTTIVGVRDTGGLVGRNYGTIKSSYATGTVNNAIAGGLVGRNEGSIDSSYATSEVSGALAGGLVAWNEGTITSSYAAGNASGTGAGGLVAWSQGTIENSYARGAVRGTGAGSDGYAGGLVGYSSSGTIKNSYARGAVNAGANNVAGGLVGYSSGASAAIENSYYDEMSTYQDDTGKGVGVSAAVNIERISGKYYDNGGTPNATEIFVDWDFTTIWTFTQGAWPTLAWQKI